MAVLRSIGSWVSDMAIQWFTTSKSVCDCVADVTQVSTMQPARRGPVNGLDHLGRRSVVRARQIRHWRESDDAYFWHWEDQAPYRVAISNTLR